MGIPRYLSQAWSLTLYAFGLAESIRIVWPGAPVQPLAALLVIGVVLKSVMDDQDSVDAVHRAFESMLPDLRMDVGLDVILRPPGEAYGDVIRRASQNADMVFMGMSVPDPGSELAYAKSLMGLLDGLPSTILVRNASRFHGRLV